MKALLALAVFASVCAHAREASSGERHYFCRALVKTNTPTLRTTQAECLEKSQIDADKLPGHRNYQLIGIVQRTVVDPSGLSSITEVCTVSFNMPGVGRGRITTEPMDCVTDGD